MKGLLLLLGVGAAIYTLIRSLLLPMMPYRAAKKPSMSRLSPIIQSTSIQLRGALTFRAGL
jgi:hypothetical protein